MNARNIYRQGTKLRQIFCLMEDGLARHIEDIAYHVFGISATKSHRRKCASALRTIRRDLNGVDIQYTRSKRYWMTSTRPY
jgi:hypothetical protein